VTGIPLRIAEPTGRYQRNLRRYRSSRDGVSECLAGSYHNASVIVGEIPASEVAGAAGDNWPHDDSRWPKTCTCGYEFTADDNWQRNDREVYRLPDGHEFVLSPAFGCEIPPGTMVRASWYDKHAQQPGESWLIILPDGGQWLTTQPAAGGGHWEVTGTAPAITASPSIWHNQPHGWHGWVRNGELVSA
jgi:Family of unknown function (DUF6527)